MDDILIRGGQVIDGTGAPARVADVAIPLPFNIGASDLANGGFYQSADSLTEPLFGLRRHQSFRPVPDASFCVLIGRGELLPVFEIARLARPPIGPGTGLGLDRTESPRKLRGVRAPGASDPASEARRAFGIEFAG